MNITDGEMDPLAPLADEFAARFRRGERPSPTEYAKRHPELADRIHQLFPALMLMEEFGSVGGRAAGEPKKKERKVPELLGEYRILREVGRGGMGVVYEAVQESLGRHVALKVLPSHGQASSTHLERFRREARAAAKLHHTNIVPVFGVGVFEGIHYYAMQFIKGQGLDRVLDELQQWRKSARGSSPENPEEAITIEGQAGAVPSAHVAQGLVQGWFPQEEGGHHRSGHESKPGSSAQAAQATRTVGGGSTAAQDQIARLQYFRSIAHLGVQVALGLAHAHCLGILHRDIKPSNLLLDTQGTVWITDFGLAKTEDSGEFTATGDLVGTLRYMPPERFQGQADARSDLYSLGLTLYELLTLQPAFAGGDRAQLIERVLHQNPLAPRTINGRIPRDLEIIVLKAMAKIPEERYQTAQELADDLQRFLNDEAILARRPSVLQKVKKWGRRHRPVVYTGGVAAAVLGVVVVVGLIINNAMISRERDEKDDALIATLREKEEKVKALVLAVREKERADRNVILVTSEKEKKEAALGIALQEKKRADANLAKARQAVKQYLVKTSGNPLLKSADFHPLRQELLATAIAFLEDFARQKQDDPELERERGRALGDLALVREELGQLAKAEADTRLRIVVFEKLADGDPKDPRYRHELANSHRNLGNLQLRLSQPSKAEKSYHAARQLLEPLLQQYEDFPQYLQDLAGCYSNLSVLLKSLGRVEEALNLCKKALALREKLNANPDATSPAYRHELAHSLMNLASLLGENDQIKEAIKTGKRGLGICAKLASEFPQVPEYQESWADCLNNLGVMLCEANQWEEALRVHDQAVHIHERLVEKYPSLPGYRLDLAMSLNNRGVLLGDLGRLEKSLAAHDDALALGEKLAGDYPGADEYRQILALTQSNRGHILRLLERSEEALAAYQVAIGLQDPLVNRPSASINSRQDLGRSLCNLSELCREMGRFAEANAASHRALALREILAREAPNNLAFQVGVVGSYGNRANLLADEGKAKESLLYYVKAFSKLNPILKREPNFAPARQIALGLHQGRARALGRLARYAEGLDELDRAKKYVNESNQGSYKLQRALFLAQLNKTVEAIAEANALAGHASAGAQRLYGAAGIFAVAARESASDPSKADQFAVRAVELLRKATHQGLQNIEFQMKNPDLDGLRARPDFKELQKVQADLPPRPKVIQQKSAGDGFPLALELGKRVKGRLTKTDPLDSFPLTPKSRCKVYSATLEAGRPYLIDLQGDFDTWVRVENLEKKPIVYNDDLRPDEYLNSRLIFFAPKKDVYRVVVTSFKPNVQGDFTLRIVEAVKKGDPIEVKDQLRGSDPKNQLGMHFQSKKIRLVGENPTTFELSSPDFEPILVLLDGKGNKVLASNDGIVPGNARLARIDFTPAAEGAFLVGVTSRQPGETGSFRLTIQQYEAAPGN